jgi:hypothetical protein
MDWQQGIRSVYLASIYYGGSTIYIISTLGEKENDRSYFPGGLGNHRYPIGFSGDTVIS